MTLPPWRFLAREHTGSFGRWERSVRLSFLRVIITLAVSLSVFATGCQGGADGVDGAAATKPNDKPRIALIMKSLANEFFATMAKGAQQHQAEHLEQYELIVNGIKDERDLNGQRQIISDMVAAGVDAIVVAPADSKALIPELRRAREAGVVVVNIDNRLDADILRQEKLAIPFVGPDNRAGARKVADYLAAKLSPGDTVIVLEGIRTSFNGAERRKGFEESMQAAGVRIVDSQSAQWEMSQANTIASSMLSEHPEIKAILAANDNMALGAVAAIRSAGRAKDVLVVGFDNISAARQAVADGKILATADQHADQLAVYGIEYALTLLADREASVVDRETPVDLITAESLQ